jgi:hypothetical protein
MTKRSTTAPWDQPGGPKRPEPERTAAEVEVSLDLGRISSRSRQPRQDTPPEASRRPQGRLARQPDPELELAEEAESSLSGDDSVSFWALPAAERRRPAARTEDEPLSGTDDDVFDPATGWDLDAVSSKAIENRRLQQAAARVAPPQSPAWPEALPPLEELEASLRPPTPEPAPPPAPPARRGVEFDEQGFFSVADAQVPTPQVEVDDESGEYEIEVDQSSANLDDDLFSQSALPSVPPDLAALPVEQAIARAQELFRTDDPAMGMAVLEATRMRAPDDPRVQTWLEYGERRLMARFCPGVSAHWVPRLMHPKEKLAVVTAGDQRVLIAAIDGRRTLVGLREALPQIPAVGFWKDVGKLQERGWIGWAVS